MAYPPPASNISIIIIIWPDPLMATSATREKTYFYKYHFKVLLVVEAINPVKD